MREIHSSDGKSPFKPAKLEERGRSRILGFSGERSFDRIVSASKGDQIVKYWVRVQSSFSMPADSDWKKLEE